MAGANRRRMTIYYVIITIENAVMYGVWFHYQVSKDINWHAPLKIDGVQRTVDTNALFMILLPCFYVTGLIAMGIYYSCYHPTKFAEPAYRSEDPALELVDGRQSGDFDVVG